MYTAGEGWGGEGLEGEVAEDIFKGAKFFRFPPLIQKKKWQSPTRLVLMRKVKYGQYDEMVQRFFKGRKQKQKVRNKSWLCSTRKLHAGVMWQLIDSIVKRNYRSLDRLNLGPKCRLAKNKPKWKEDNQRKSQQKGRWKAIIQLVLKDTEWPDPFRHKKKRGLQVGLPLKKGPHTLHSENTNIDLSKRGDGS